MTLRNVICTCAAATAIALTAACSSTEVTPPKPPVTSSPEDTTTAVVDIRSFVWTRETGAVEIPIPAHATGMIVTDINDAGQVVGSVAMQAWEYTRAFLWSAADGYTPLGSLVGPDGISSALSLNDSGAVSGRSYGPSSRMSGPMGVLIGDAFVWNSKSGMKRVDGVANLYSIGRINAAGNVIGDSQAGTFTWNVKTGAHFLPLSPGTTCSRAADINDSGQILGYAGTIKNGGCRFSSVLIWNADGSQMQIEDCPNHVASQDPCAISAVAMNNRGEVIGVRGTQGFRWSALRGFTYFPGAAVTLTGLNNRGDVVGNDFTDGMPKPFVWSASGEIAAIALPSGSTSGVAVAINSAGQVVGTFR